MKVELTKREVGIISLALERYVRNHSFFKEIRNVKETSMQCAKLYLGDLLDATKTCIKMQEILNNRIEYSDREEGK